VTGLTYKHGVNTLGTLSYGYDRAGQRTQVGGTWTRVNRPAALTSATYDAANRQLTFGGATLTYDHNGNLTGVCAGGLAAGRIRRKEQSALLEFLKTALAAEDLSGE
jgi:hypothetical protein